MTFSPHIGPDLFELVDALDDGEKGRAQIWRELGVELRARGLFQPSYESVRRIVNVVRELRTLAYSKLKRALVLSAEYLWNLRDRKGIVLDIFDGNDIERRRERYRWKSATPRAGASAARSPSETASRRAAP
ncbi:MAG: hypothetical protein ABUS54_13040 [Actinomycetota bacterium]